MAQKLQIQYDDMDSIAQSMDRFADSVNDHMQRIQRLVGDLQGGGWKGVGADAFYDEMLNEVLPKLDILKTGFEVAGTETRRISQMFNDAEQTILSYFASL